MTQRQVAISSAWLLSLAIQTVSLAPAANAQSHPAPAVIDGGVTDTSLVPLGDATVSILGSRLRVVTGANGRFRISDVAPGQYILLIRRLGFEATSARVQTDAADTLRLSFALERITTSLATVVIAANRPSTMMSEFEERRSRGLRFGGGQFMSQEEIEKRNTVFATELIRTFSGVEVRPMSGLLPGYVAASARGTGSIILNCFPAIWLDGLQLPGPVNLDDLPSPKELAGIEVYAGPATVPLRYARGGMSCGAILIWTR